MKTKDASASAAPNTAEFHLKAGPVRLRARVAVTAEGLIAVGGLVSGVLLSTAALVWVSTAPVRRHPVSTRLGPRR
ncbi:MAG: hypothetical protein ACK4I0_01315 [Brevundimonas sp.]|uniref:hypothetical protein n=1 Tax=Brevundimonas sp. TaxID=1871086 RepID=UPI00391A0E9B